MAPGNLPGALVYPSPRSPRFPTASSAVFQGPPIDFLFQPSKTLSGALEASRRPMGKTRRSERAPTHTKSRNQAIRGETRPRAGCAAKASPTTRGGPPRGPHKPTEAPLRPGTRELARGRPEPACGSPGRARPSNGQWGRRKVSAPRGPMRGPRRERADAATVPPFLRPAPQGAKRPRTKKARPTGRGHRAARTGPPKEAPGERSN